MGRGGALHARALCSAALALALAAALAAAPPVAAQGGLGGGTATVAGQVHVLSRDAFLKVRGLKRAVAAGAGAPASCACAPARSAGRPRVPALPQNPARA